MSFWFKVGDLECHIGQFWNYVTKTGSFGGKLHQSGWS